MTVTSPPSGPRVVRRGVRARLRSAVAIAALLVLARAAGRVTRARGIRRRPRRDAQADPTPEPTPSRRPARRSSRSLPSATASSRPARGWRYRSACRTGRMPRPRRGRSRCRSAPRRCRDRAALSAGSPATPTDVAVVPVGVDDARGGAAGRRAGQRHPDRTGRSGAGRPRAGRLPACRRRTSPPTGRVESTSAMIVPPEGVGRGRDRRDRADHGGRDRGGPAHGDRAHRADLAHRITHRPARRRRGHRRDPRDRPRDPRRHPRAGHGGTRERRPNGSHDSRRSRTPGSRCSSATRTSPRSCRPGWRDRCAHSRCRPTSTLRTSPR